MAPLAAHSRWRLAEDLWWVRQSPQRRTMLSVTCCWGSLHAAGHLGLTQVLKKGAVPLWAPHRQAHAAQKAWRPQAPVVSPQQHAGPTAHADPVRHRCRCGPSVRGASYKHCAALEAAGGCDHAHVRTPPPGSQPGRRHDAWGSSSRGTSRSAISLPRISEDAQRSQHSTARPSHSQKFRTRHIPASLSAASLADFDLPAAGR